MAVETKTQQDQKKPVQMGAFKRAFTAALVSGSIMIASAQAFGQETAGKSQCDQWSAQTSVLSRKCHFDDVGACKTLIDIYEKIEQQCPDNGMYIAPEKKPQDDCGKAAEEYRIKSRRCDYGNYSQCAELPALEDELANCRQAPKEKPAAECEALSLQIDLHAKKCQNEVPSSCAKFNAMSKEYKDGCVGKEPAKAEKSDECKKLFNSMKKLSDQLYSPQHDSSLDAKFEKAVEEYTEKCNAPAVKAEDKKEEPAPTNYDEKPFYRSPSKRVHY